MTTTSKNPRIKRLLQGKTLAFKSLDQFSQETYFELWQDFEAENDNELYLDIYSSDYPGSSEGELTLTDCLIVESLKGDVDKYMKDHYNATKTRLRKRG